MTPEQLKEKVRKFKRESGDNDIIAVLDEVLERELVNHLEEENKRHSLAVKKDDWRKADEIAIEICKKRIKLIEEFWEKSCKLVYPEFEERTKVKIKQCEDDIKGFEKNLKDKK